MLPLILAHSAPSAIKNIQTFNIALRSEKYPSIYRLLSHVQAWYVWENENGELLFGPSKFIGYEDMTPDFYIEETGANGRLDGRVTEKRLSPWTEEVSTSDERFSNLYSSLSLLCAKYGAYPNARARISVFRDLSVSEAPTEDEQVKAISVLIASLARCKTQT